MAWVTFVGAFALTFTSGQCFGVMRTGETTLPFKVVAWGGLLFAPVGIVVSLHTWGVI